MGSGLGGGQQAGVAGHYLGQPFTYEPLAFGLKKGDYDSINFINNFLHQIREDGTYQRIHDKWFKNTEWLKEME